MARVTVEDCVVQVPNRFDLVMLSAHRARALSLGAEALVEKERDKNPVIALREVADQKLDLAALQDSLVKSLQKRIERDEPEEAVAELLASEQQTWINADVSEGEDDLDGDEGDDEAEEGDIADGELGNENLDAGSFEDAPIQDEKA